MTVVVLLIAAAFLVARARTGDDDVSGGPPAGLRSDGADGSAPVERANPPSPLIGRPLLGADRIFVLTEHGVAAVERDADRTVWQQDVCYGPDWVDPRRDDPLDVLVVRCDDGIRGVDPADGRSRWFLPRQAESDYVRTAGRSLVMTDPVTLRVYDLGTGVLRWAVTLGGDNYPVAAGAGRVFVSAGGALRAYDESTGTEAWVAQVEVGWIHADGDRVYVRGFGHDLTVLDAATGAIVWQARDRDPALRGTVIVGPVGGTDGGHLVVGTEGRLQGRRPGDGRADWSVEGVYAAFAGHGVVVSTGPQALTVHDGATGATIWSDPGAARAFAPSFDERTLSYVVGGRLHVRPLPR